MERRMLNRGCGEMRWLKILRMVHKVSWLAVDKYVADTLCKDERL